MINLISENSFELNSSDVISKWLSGIIHNENYKEGELLITFCNDDYLHKLNMEFLAHDNLTDVLTFEYNMGNVLSGDICISTERVRENAEIYNTTFFEEIARVMAHGVLHLCGYADNNEQEKKQMRSKEDFYLQQLFSK